MLAQWLGTSSFDVTCVCAVEATLAYRKQSQHAKPGVQSSGMIPSILCAQGSISRQFLPQTLCLCYPNFQR